MGKVEATVNGLILYMPPVFCNTNISRLLDSCLLESNDLTPLPDQRRNHFSKNTFNFENKMEHTYNVLFSYVHCKTIHRPFACKRRSLSSAIVNRIPLDFGSEIIALVPLPIINTFV